MFSLKKGVFFSVKFYKYLVIYNLYIYKYLKNKLYKMKKTSFGYK